MLPLGLTSICFFDEERSAHFLFPNNSSLGTIAFLQPSWSSHNVSSSFSLPTGASVVVSIKLPSG